MNQRFLVIYARLSAPKKAGGYSRRVSQQRIKVLQEADFWFRDGGRKTPWHRSSCSFLAVLLSPNPGKLFAFALPGDLSVYFMDEQVAQNCVPKLNEAHFERHPVVFTGTS